VLYTALKGLHVGCAAISLALFVLRGVWRMTAPERLARRWVRIVPHAVDSVLLASAIGALATFAYIVSVAVTKSPLGFFAGMLAS